MKICYKFITTIVFCLVGIYFSFGQYVSIIGRQFKDEFGNDFYPVVCNYAVYYMFLSENDWFLRPYIDYDGWGWECWTNPGCLNQMQRHFDQIKAMGFNTVRFFGGGPYYVSYDPDKGNGFLTFQIKGDNYPGSGYSLKNLSKPYTTDPTTQKIFEGFNNVLYRAYLAGLKVILHTAGGPKNVMYSSDFATDYAEYLDAISIYMANYSNPESRVALMAYDIMNEPLYSNQTGWPDISEGHEKIDVCIKMNDWYNIIKSNDPNHLVTLGGSGFRDVYEYDPAVLKVDFYSIHPYSKKMGYEDDLGLPFMVDRIYGDIYWTMKNCPMPFIIGETSFKAISEQGGPDGNFAEQKSYAESTLQHNLDCMGSGYSWWEYQENSTGTGLLKNGYCNPICQELEKPVVEAFEEFDPEGITYPCDGPANYYDPYNHFFYGW